VDGRVGLDTYTKDRILDERTLALAAAVEHTVDPTSRLPDGFPGWVGLVCVTAGSSKRGSLMGAGGRRDLSSPNAIVAKFRDNARRALPADRVGGDRRSGLSLDALDKVARLLPPARVIAPLRKLDFTGERYH